MATLISSSFLISSPTSNLPSLSVTSTPRVSLSSSHLSLSYVSLSSSFLTFPAREKRSSLSSFIVKASADEKKKALIINTNSGGHAVIGFYFAKELLGSGHQVTVLTVGEENSDKMKKPPFNRFSVKTKRWILPFVYG